MAEEDESPAEKADWAKSYEELKDRVDNLEDAIADLKADKQPRGEEEVEASVEETPKEEIKEELSKVEMVEPIKHNPETENAEINYVFSKNRIKTTADRAYERLLNN